MRRLSTLSERPVRLRTEEARSRKRDRASTARAAEDTAASPGLAARWLALWMPDPIERASFRLAAAYMRRDRDLRMRLYPSLASYLAFPIIALIDPRVGSFAPALTVVMVSLLPASALWTLKTSSQYLAADIFRYAPLAGTAALFHGARKAVLLFLTAPVLAISSLLLGFAVKDREWLLAVVPAIVLLPTLSLIEGLPSSFIPLSVAPVTGRQGAIQIALYSGTAALVGGLSVLGWAAQRRGLFWPMVAVEAVLVGLLHALMLRSIRARRLEPAS
jgi:hypothetical protein